LEANGQNPDWHYLLSLTDDVLQKITVISKIYQQYFVSICLGAVKKSKHGGEFEKNRYFRFVRTPNLGCRQIKGFTEAPHYWGKPH